MIGNLNHVAIAVPDLEAACNGYRNMLGASVSDPKDEPDHGVAALSQVGDQCASDKAR